MKAGTSSEHLGRTGKAGIFMHFGQDQEDMVMKENTVTKELGYRGYLIQPSSYQRFEDKYWRARCSIMHPDAYGNLLTQEFVITDRLLQSEHEADLHAIRWAKKRIDVVTG
ncbi:MAG TPA: HlyU family transcriptional regulator [Deltaproteobacteria bacterium]|jgi:hypothetical protein|nr:hypothetical protein [Deltaproteobacteria bacterium]HNQ84315.1 HlyU family transcriptional regulator [Deltaproteobacteria bacterium]HNS90408.1 HlyU family transcriptional regulator [Deltaproteobacteria bacterium]HOY75226.1 HlyU family transcriptional regulator [Deltaproteobacteria bacterium]HPH49641.1 HlyU family transcriptional regulator [Deltaproteobacteria bacterium]